MKKAITYVKVTQQEFFNVIMLSKDKGMYTKFGGFTFGCRFVYGDAGVYKDNDHIVAMIDHESDTYNIENSFYNDIYYNSKPPQP